MKYLKGETDSAEYRCWAQMKNRCLDVNDNRYHLYGGRGITVCKEWVDSYVAFLSYVGRKPSPKHVLDRYPNNDGNYEPGNVRWATYSENGRNTRQNVLLTLNGVTLCVVEWSERTSLPQSTIRDRVNRGWSVERALTTPRRDYPKF